VSNCGEFYTSLSITEIITEIINLPIGGKILVPSLVRGILASAIENIRA